MRRGLIGPFHHAAENGQSGRHRGTPLGAPHFKRLGLTRNRRKIGYLDGMNAALMPMTADEFLQWNLGRVPKHEYVGGIAVAMAGGTRGHATRAVNLLAALKSRLGRGPCRPFGSDFAVSIPSGNVRYPDVSVDCGKGDPRSLAALSPKIVVEVLSQSNTLLDQTRRLQDYQSVPDIQEIVFVEADVAEGVIHRRAANGWTVETIDGHQGTLRLESLGIEVPFTELWDFDEHGEVTG